MKSPKQSQNGKMSPEVERRIEFLESHPCDETALELLATARFSVQALINLGKSGNKFAAIFSVQELSRLILYLHKAREENPEAFLDVERMSSHWPGLLSVDNDSKKANDEFLHNDLQLGKDSMFNFDKKQSSRNTPEVEAAWELFCAVHPSKNELKLPNFCRETANQWWKEAQPFVKKIYGERFENHKLFSKHYQISNVTKKQASDKGLKFETWRRQQILTKIQQAFGKIARKK